MAKLHILADHEHPFWTNVNTDSGAINDSKVISVGVTVNRVEFPSTEHKRLVRAYTTTAPSER